MPTTLDAFIVTLGLDATQFTEGQRQMAASLRQMETGADRAAQNIERRGIGVVSFFRALESPLGTIRSHFERLATVTATPQRNLLSLAQQGRRTGQEVEAGALQGASGLRAMGVAGLTAVAAFIALDKVRSGATDVARNLFGVGVGAAGAGIPIQQFTAISQALLHGGNVPETETQGWLSQIRSAQIQAQHGSPEAANALAVNLAKMGVTGVNAYQSSPEQIMEAIADRFHSVSADVAISLGDMVGQSAALSLALHNLGAAGLEEQAQLERQRAATDAQSAAAKDLTLAQANLDIAWQNLERRIGEEIDPALARFDDLVAHVLDRLSGRTGADIATTAAASLIPGIGPFVGAWNALKGWFGRSGKVGTATSFAPGGGSDVDAIRQAVGAAGGNEQTQAAFLAMFNPESGLGASTVEGGGTKGAGGLGGASWAQWTASRRRELEAFGWTGTDPIKDRAAAAKMLYWELTTKQQFRAMIQQMNSAGSATDAAKIGGFTFEQGGGSPSLFGRGGETQSGLDYFHSSQASAWYSAIRSAQAGGNSTTHNTSNDVDVNGGIHIYGADTGNGYKLGGAVNDAIESQLLTNQINTGQQ